MSRYNSNCFAGRKISSNDNKLVADHRQQAIGPHAVCGPPFRHIKSKTSRYIFKDRHFWDDLSIRIESLWIP